MARALLGQMLRQEGLVTDAQLASALLHQRKWRCRIGDALVQLRAIDEDRLLDVASRQLGVPALHGVASLALSPELLRRLPSRVVLRHRVLPVAAVQVHGRERLVVAFARPDDLNVVGEVEFAARTPVQPALAAASDLDRAIARHYAYLRPDALELPPEPGPMHLVDGRTIR